MFTQPKTDMNKTLTIRTGKFDIERGRYHYEVYAAD